MKKLLMKVLMLTVLISSAGVWTSCTKDKELYRPENGGNTKPESEYFDFNTTRSVTLNLQYGSFGARTLLSVYTTNPLKGSQNGEFTRDADFSIFADDNGAFRGAAVLPAYADSVWVAAEGFGLPTLTLAKVENGVVTVDAMTIEASQQEANAVGTTRAGGYQYQTVDAQKKLYTIVSWGTNQYGKLNYNYNNAIFSAGKVSVSDVKSVQQTLWKGNSSKPANLDNSALETDTKHVNTTIARAFKDANGKTQTVENAEVWLTILHERAGYQNAIGYYYYKTDEVPTDGSQVEKFIVTPNVSFSGDDPYTNSGTRDNVQNGSRKYGRNNAPLSSYATTQANKRIQLLFKDPTTGEMTTKFPAGYTIGYFIISDGWWVYDGRGQRYGRLATSNPYFYSNNEWNANQKKYFISATLKDGTVVYGVEDGADKSYDDLLFTIDANPALAIQDPDRPVIDPDVKETYSTETTYRTYAYEDIWPDGGDYDLNDVIILHKRSITFGNTNNEITTIVDEFTPVQPAGSADYTNAFAVQYVNRGASIVLDEGMIDETQTNSVIVTENANAHQNRTFSVTRTFSGVKKNAFSENLNPYIIAKYVKDDANRTEIHMPKQQSTSRANSALKNTLQDAYYIDKEGLYPFAISLPISNFSPSSERVNIGKSYSRYELWVTSKGEKHADWYLYE